MHDKKKNYPHPSPYPLPHPVPLRNPTPAFLNPKSTPNPRLDSKPPWVSAENVGLGPIVLRTYNSDRWRTGAPPYTHPSPAPPYTHPSPNPYPYSFATQLSLLQTNNKVCIFKTILCIIHDKTCIMKTKLTRTPTPTPTPTPPQPNCHLKKQRRKWRFVIVYALRWYSFV